MDDSSTDESPIPDNGLFRALISYYNAQNRLMWSRVQVFLAVQTGVLGAAYVYRNNAQTAGIALLLGAAISIALLLMFNRDEQIRNHHLDLTNTLGNALAASYGGFNLLPETNEKPAPENVFKMRCHAGELCRRTFLGIIILDVLLCALCFWWPEIARGLLSSR